LPNWEGTASPFRIKDLDAHDILATMADGRHRQGGPGTGSGRGTGGRGTGSSLSSGIRTGIVKVPEVTVYFWIVKLLTTAMGEAISDYMVNDVNKYLGVLVGFVVFAIAIFFQFRSKVYRTWLYWTAVSMVAVFGTMCADVLHVVLGLPYTVSFTLYAVLLAATFITWYRSERTLDIHTISTRRREVFYWLAVIFTFAMGTAVGDLTAITVHLGYLSSAFLFMGMICIPLIAWRLGVNPVVTFWVAYVLTRPIGASFADYFGMAKNISGLGLGHGPTSLALIVVVAAGVWFLKASGKDAQQPQALSSEPAGYGYDGDYGQSAGYAAPRGYDHAPQDRGYAPQGGHGHGGYAAPQDGFSD
jgi:uncharacterized membrane-anchored protein